MRPNDRKYQKSHEWCLIADGVATVGITDYAVAHLSDLVFLDLPEIGSKVTAGETFGEIESVKAVSDLYSPVSGDVLETNEAFIDNLDTLNSGAFDAGWMMKIRVAEESTELLELAAYEKQLENEEE